MKTKKNLVYGLLAVILTLAFVACSGGGGKSLNSADALKEYLDKQPANSSDKPIRVAMKANEMMIKDIGEVIKNAGKYVNLNLSGSPLTEIPNSAFRDCKTLVGIIIPNSVTSIGESAFSGTGLTSLTIPDSVTSIGNGAFNGCTSLTGINIPSAVTSIGERVFMECSSLTSITIPSSVTSIGIDAFRKCASLTGINIPSVVTSIGNNAFRECAGLTSVTIEVGVTSIGSYAFASCTSLTSVAIPSSVTSIGYRAFDGDMRAFNSDWKEEDIVTYTKPSGSDAWTKQ